MEMLRITMSVSGEAATKYFDAALATSKYYGSERGQWGGKGAERLRLHGDVNRKDFIALASNKRPGTDETLTVRMKTTRKQKEAVFDKKANTYIHAFTFNATFDPEEERWKAGEFGNIKRDAPFYEAAFHARLAEQLLENGFAIRRTDWDFEFASVSRELVEKFSKRTRLIEQLARERYTVLWNAL
jgi:TrwC relaxase